MELVFGKNAIRETSFGHDVSTANGVIHIAAPGAWASHVGVQSETDIAPAGSACIGIDIRVKNLDAVRGFIRSAKVHAYDRPDGVTIGSHAEFGNVTLRFVE